MAKAPTSKKKKKAAKKSITITPDPGVDRRAEATFNFVKSLADEGNEKAAAFLNKLLGGGFDGEPGDS